MHSNFNDLKNETMEAEQFLDNDLKGAHQVYDETGVTLITGIEHSEICRIMDEYHEHKLKLLGIANVSKSALNDEWNAGYNRGCEDTHAAYKDQM